MRKTPYERIRYPWTSDTVNAADVQTMAADIDQTLVNTAALVTNFSRMSSVVVQRAATQSIVKGTLTAITFDTVTLDNGTDSALANGAWFKAATPTRLTAPGPCVVLACGVVGLNFGTALGVNGCTQTSITLNGAGSGTGMQGSKWNPTSTDTGFQSSSAITMWNLQQGDFLELKAFWTGTPAGPFLTDTFWQPILSIMMVGLTQPA